jgi:diguanylate cyclase (GGDEF)-like protein
MISLRRALDREDRAQNAQDCFRASVDAYGNLLMNLERLAEAVAAEDSRVFQERVSAVRARLGADVPLATIRDCRQVVEQQLEQFTADANILRDRKEHEFQQVIRIVAEAAAAMSQSDSSTSAEILQFAARIDSVSKLSNVTEMRKQLALGVTDLKSMAGRIQSQGQSRAGVLSNLIRKAQARIRVATALAEVDPLTGLGNRLMAEHAVRTAVSAGNPFSLLLFQLEGIQPIRDKHGRMHGDQLLVAVAKQMKTCVRDGDVVCRWGEDQFAAVVENAPLADAEGRAARMAKETSGDYVLEVGGRTVNFRVTASVAAVEYRSGESAGDFCERADQAIEARELVGK